MTNYEYKPDPKLIYRMKQRLAKHLGCSYGEVSRIKKNLVIQYIMHTSLSIKDMDTAEYMVVMSLANEFKDRALARLMHLYSVGYFQEDTRIYVIQTGEQYEIINTNYLGTFDYCGLLKTKAA